MRRKFCLFVPLCLCVFSLFAKNAEGQAAAAAVQGRVFKAATTQPIGKVNLELRHLDAKAAQPLIATTSDDGRFVFRGVPPGRYQLLAARNGYVPTESGLPITIAAGQPLPDIELRMIPTGAISGRIFDRSGQPVVNADVQAMRATYQDGQRVLTLVQSARTNDLGEYRIFWLPPDQYFVHATAWDGTPLGSPVVMNPGSQTSPGGARFSLVAGDRPAPGFRTPGALPSATEARVPIYFPGTMNDEAATPIDVRSEMTFAGVDITIAPIRPRRIQGVIVDATGQPARAAQLTRSRAPSGGTYYVDQVDDDSGTFDIRGVIPGSYTLVAVAGGMTGRLPIEVGDNDLDNITIQLKPGIDITGRIIFDGGDFAGMRASLRADPMIPGMSQPFGAPAADGSFMIPGVFPGNYRVLVQPFQTPPRSTMLPSINRRVSATSITVSPAANPVQAGSVLPAASPTLQNAYIKSIRLGNTDVLAAGLQVDSMPEHPLEIVIGMNGATVDGVVLDKKRQPVPNVPVALVPDQGRNHRTDLFKSAMTDAAGRFRLHGIAPGGYKLFSWENVENGAWIYPDFLRPYEEAGRRVQVIEGSKENLEIPVIPTRN